MPDLPARFAVLIITFAPLFDQRSWRHAQVLLAGAILAPGRRTVASVLRIADGCQAAISSSPPTAASRRCCSCLPCDAAGSP